jgi:3-dehydroquinate synthase
MSGLFEIRSASGGYTVKIEQGSFARLLQEQGGAIYVADEWFQPELSRAGIPALFLAANETTKSLESIPKLILDLKSMGANRQTHILALGGGIVQDVATFVTSVYMRGIPWSYIPTTVLAMVDSCIGGKSSINVGTSKNIVGTFHPPTSITIDPVLAYSLNVEQRVSGLIEAAKICYCKGADTFADYLGLSPGAAIPVDRLESVITLSLMAKKWFIEIDEHDRKERLLLNFGHTFGHAIEGASHFRISHGIGVALGIQCAIEMQRLRGIRYDAGGRAALLEAHLGALLAAVPTLTAEIKALSTEAILDCFQGDKKHGTHAFKVVLIAESGDVELVAMPREEESLRSIRAAVSGAMERFL